tara:strand:- start:250 stop:381 length:132 start_codon:yes stop_codon:yes gene_type:complete
MKILKTPPIIPIPIHPNVKPIHQTPVLNQTEEIDIIEKKNQNL